MGSELVWRWCVAGNGLMRCFYNNSNNTAIAKASSLYLSSPKAKPKFLILTPVPPLALVRITRSSFSLNLGQGYSSSSSSSSSNENNNIMLLRLDSGLEAFSHTLTNGSFRSLFYQINLLPEV